MTSHLDLSALYEALETSFPGKRALSKRQILASSLVCFDEKGIEATRVEHITQLSESSIGSLYHHFKSKEGLIASLFFIAMDDQIGLIRPELQKVNSADDAVRALVRSYLIWVQRQPMLARFMLQARSQVAKGPRREEWLARNKRRFSYLYKWVVQGIEQGRIIRLPKEVYASLLIGPAENYSRAWLSGRVEKPPVKVADVFADAAWRAIAHSDE